MTRAALEKLAREIGVSVYNAYCNTLVGTAPQGVHELNARMKDVRVGDLVVEMTTLLMPTRSPLDAVGYLLRETHEPVRFSDPDFVWDEKEEGAPASCRADFLYPYARRSRISVVERFFYLRSIGMAHPRSRPSRPPGQGDRPPWVSVQSLKSKPKPHAASCLR